MFLPSWYDSSMCGQLRTPNLNRAADDGIAYAKQNNINASRKEGGICLAAIDVQLDFVSPVGNLSVPGAIADTDRLCKFIYNNINKIDRILASLDTHYLFQPFHPYNWIAGPNPVNRPNNGKIYVKGENPDPFTLISMNDIKSGAWEPTRNPRKMLQMVEQLEQNHKKTLCIWPLHCILGTPGHALEPSFMEAIYFHSAARQTQYNATVKGMSQLSEHYGILRAEVVFPEDPNTQLNMSVLNDWENADKIYFAGQAKSHCVLETLNQVVDNFMSRNSDLLKKLVVLIDCMSSVKHPVIDFESIVQNRFKELSKLGVKFANSTDPIN